MGRMKDLYIDQMNNDHNGPDDTDWNAPEYNPASFTKADTEPQPEAVQADRKPMIASYIEVNEHNTNTPNSNGWISMNKLDPPPDEINTTTGKSMWVINGYKIWAHSYQQALELLPMIESF